MLIYVKIRYHTFGYHVGVFTIFPKNDHCLIHAIERRSKKSLTCNFSQKYSRLSNPANNSILYAPKNLYSFLSGELSVEVTKLYGKQIHLRVF